MSDRGSFVSEYFYCTACMETVYARLREQFDEKYLNTVRRPDKPILVGKVNSLAPGWEWEPLVDALDGLTVCHPVSFVVLSENGQVAKVRLNTDGQVLSSLW